MSKTKPKPPFLAGWHKIKRHQYELGFMRACLLFYGNKNWTAAEHKLANRITRKLFGRKRNAKSR